MNNMLNFTDEFNHLMALLEKTWNIPNFQVFKEEVAKPVFNKGLANGRIWIDTLLMFRIGREINEDPTVLDPLNNRLNKHKIDGNFDSLYLLTEQMFAALNELSKSAKSFQKASVSDKVKSLVKKYHQYRTPEISAKSFSKSEQAEHILSYPGFSAGNRSISTPEKLAFSEVEFCLIELGKEPFQLLINAIYSHGLACAQERNEQELIAILTPVYVEHYNEQFNVSLHEKFMPVLLEHELFGLLNAAYPFKFFTFEEYTKALYTQLQKRIVNDVERLPTLAMDRASEEVVKNQWLDMGKKHEEYISELNRQLYEQMQLNPGVFKSTVHTDGIVSSVHHTSTEDVDARIKQHLEKLSVYSVD